MMEDVRSPMFAAQPFEESQGVDSSPLASPEALDAFYKDMKIKESLERKLSRRSRTGTSIWSRKSVKRSSTAPPVVNLNPARTSPNHQRNSSELETNGREAGAWLMDNQDSQADLHQTKLQSPRSLVSDSLKDLNQNQRDPWASIPLPGSTKEYKVHNPLGPRWYKNHHLIPPGEKKPTARPPTFFSASFPGITTSSSQERFEDGQPPGPSRTPSNSPLPTPDSSQTRVFDGSGKPRIRKTSQTAHDNVDLMDPTDPWGTHWHHKSPYDIGLANEPISIDIHGAAYSRGRRASMTTQSRGQTIKPSPLSQSASAVNLSTPRDFVVHMPRKLSKRRTANGNILAGYSQSLGHSTGPSPVKPRPASENSIRPPMTGYHPSMTSLTSKKEKRGSVLGRLVRKFSLLRKGSQENTRPPEPLQPDEWHHVGESLAPRTSQDFRREQSPERQSPSPQDPSPEPRGEVTPSPEERPPVQLQLPGPALIPQPEQSLLFPDHQSVLSVEAHFSVGKLTVANPDNNLESEHNTPILTEMPLPGQEPGNRDTQISTMSDITYMPRSSMLEKDILLNLSLEKTLPPPPPMELPTPNVPSVSLQHSYTPQTTLSTLTQAQTQLSVNTEATQASSSAASFTTQATGKNTQLPALDSSTNYVCPPKRASTQITKSPECILTARLPTTSPLPAAHLRISLDHSATRGPSTYQRISLDHMATPKPPPSQRISPDHTATPSATADTRTPHRPSPIPFPISDTESLPNIPSIYDYSPYSASSVLANPPTPAPPRDIPVLKSKEREYRPSPLARPQNNHTTAKKSSQSHPHEIHAVTRLTETFKLVRSPSGNVHTGSAATMAGGDQWEVVGSPAPERSNKENPGKLEKRRDKSARESRASDPYRDRGDDSPTSPTREREKKRESRSKGEVDNREHRHDRERSQHDIRSRDHSSRESREREREHRDRDREHSSKAHKTKDKEQYRESKDGSSSSRQETPHHPEASSSNREHRSRKYDDRTLDRKAANNAVATVKARETASPDSGPEPRSSVARRTSSSARPTSQLPSAAELNALRAREAWEMERLWKARSINGESSGFSIPGYGSPSFATIDGLIPTSVVHGTNHTTFVVQAPFIPNNSIYHSMPTVPPPIIYPSEATTNKPAKKEKAQKQRKRDSVSAVPPADHNKPLPPALRPPNPLPTPPRDSFHDAKPFPQASGSTRPTDYWSPLAGITTSR